MPKKAQIVISVEAGFRDAVNRKSEETGVPVAEVARRALAHWVKTGELPPGRSTRMTYNPQKGGHAPGHLRDAFAEAIENSGGKRQWWDHIDADQFTDEQVRTMPREELASWLLGQLWNCTDVMPSSLCDDLELPAGSTYAAGVRNLKSELVK
jgi:hypothetical protein